METVRVSIVTFDSAVTIEDCLRSVLAEHDPPRRVSVIDNGSADGTAERVRASFPDVELIEGATNRGFAAAQPCSGVLGHGFAKEVFVAVDLDEVIPARGLVQQLGPGGVFVLDHPRDST